MICKCFVGNRWNLLEKFGYMPEKLGDMFLHIHNQSYTSGANLNYFNDLTAPEITISDLLCRLEQSYTATIVEMFESHIKMFQNHNTPNIHKQIMYFAKVIVDCVKNEHNVLIAGNGGSAADAQHFAAELVVRFKKNRQGIPAIALTTDTSVLTAIVNDFGARHMFSRQIKTIGEQGDVFIAISTSGNSENILEAIDEAHNNGMGVIALTGKDGGEIKNLVTDQDLFIVNEHETGRIQEMHEFILHTIAELVEDQFPTTAAPNIPGVKSARIKADRIAEMVKSW
jgi:D-sedoheptulose 7-phosphate isomerase